MKIFADINDNDERNDLINDVLKQTIDAVRENDQVGTYINYIGYDEVNVWAIVVALMDYDDTGDWKPYAKLAYQSRNSMMQEYDMDWLMPQMNGEVWDTEISWPCRIDVIWLLEQFESYLFENDLKIKNYEIEKKEVM